MPVVAVVVGADVVVVMRRRQDDCCCRVFGYLFCMYNKVIPQFRKKKKDLREWLSFR